MKHCWSLFVNSALEVINYVCTWDNILDTPFSALYTSTFLHDAKTWKTLEKPIIALIILKNKEDVDF